MRLPIRFNGLMATCLLACGLVIGCQAESSIPLHPTSGNLTVNGEPARGAILAFHPTSGAIDERGSIPAGKVKEDGTFVVSTFGIEDGAPEGQYAVTVFWPQFPGRDDPGEDRMRGKYALPSSPATTVTITAGNNTLPPLDLKASNMLRGD